MDQVGGRGAEAQTLGGRSGAGWGGLGGVSGRVRLVLGMRVNNYDAKVKIIIC